MARSAASKGEGKRNTPAWSVYHAGVVLVKIYLSILLYEIVKCVEQLLSSYCNRQLYKAITIFLYILTIYYNALAVLFYYKGGDTMSTKEARYAATARYQKKAYDKILLRLPKGEKDRVQQQAETAGLSLNGFILSAVREVLNNG